MPSIKDIEKKNTTKMFDQSFYRPLDEVLPTKTNSDSENSTLLSKTKEIDQVFNKVAYRPWDDDKPTSKPLFNKGKSPLSNVHEKKRQLISGIDSITHVIFSLFGVQKTLFVLLLNNISHEENMFAYTSPLSIRDIIEITGFKKRTVDTSLRRMIDKKIIESWDFKPGRGGYVVYRISDLLKREYFKHKSP